LGSHEEDYKFILTQLYDATRKSSSIGRKVISKQAENQGIFLTEQEVRGMLQQMDNFKLVKVSKGRSGTKITEKGIRFLQEFK
jgi:repressor of nif and glnA expression